MLPLADFWNAPLWGLLMTRSILALFMMLVATCAQSAVISGSLADDSRLDRAVTVSVPLATLETVLGQISEQTGVMLSAEKAISDDTVVAIVRDRPARDLMKQLALALDYSWKIEKSTPVSYRLYESDEAKARSKSRSRQYRATAGVELDHQLKLTLKYVEKYRGLPRREITADVERLRAESMQLPVGHERLVAERELFAAERAQEPMTSCLLAAYVALPATAQQQILEGRRTIMASARPTSVRMPPDILANLRSARQFEVARASRDAGIPPARQTQDETIDFLSGMRFGQLVLDIRGRYLGDESPRPATSLPRFNLSPSQVMYGNPLTDNRPGQITAEVPDSLDQRVNLMWPGKKFIPEDPLTYCRGVLLSEVLKVLADRQPSLQFVGDAYFKALRPLPQSGNLPPGTPAGFDPAERSLMRLTARNVREGGVALRDVLTELANRGNVNIHVGRDGWIRFQSTVYFNDRTVRLDPRVVRQLYEPVASGQPYTRETALAVARRLSYPQVEALTAEYLAFLPDQRPVWRMRASWESWRIIGSLTDEHRQKLWSRQSLRVGALTAEERMALRSVLEGFSNRVGGIPIDLDVGPTELGALTVALGAPQRDGSDAFELWLPNFVQPLLRQSLQVQEGSGLGKQQ